MAPLPLSPADRSRLVVLARRLRGHALGDAAHLATIRTGYRTNSQPGYAIGRLGGGQLETLVTAVERAAGLGPGGVAPTQAAQRMMVFQQQRARNQPARELPPTARDALASYLEERLALMDAVGGALPLLGRVGQARRSFPEGLRLLRRAAHKVLAAVTEPEPGQ